MEWVLGEQHDLARIEQRHVASSCGQRWLGSLDRNHVGEGHPVERSVPSARRCIEVEMQVEVRDGDALERSLDAADRPDPDRAVATQDEGDALVVERCVGDACGRRADNVCDRVEILGPWICAIGSPGNNRGVSEIVHLQPRADELLDEPCRSDCPRRPLLTDTAGAGARGRTDNGYAPGHAPFVSERRRHVESRYGAEP
jgi:hypothetical protein